MSDTATKPLTVADLMSLLNSNLVAWAKKYGGTVSVARERFNAMELLLQGPGKLRVIISYAGWKKRGDYEESRAVDHVFKFGISTARLLTAVAGASLIQPVAGERPLFELQDRLCARLRSIEFADGVTEGMLDLTNCDEVITPEGVLVDAYEITASLGATQSDEQ